MAISQSPLTELLARLDAASGSTSQGELEELLKRIKNLLIGNTSRKLQLAHPDSRAALSRIVDLLKDDESGGSNALNPSHVSLLVEALAIISALAIPREECLSGLYSLQVHQVLLEYITRLYQGYIASDASGTDVTIAYGLIAHAMRALKSFYVAIVNYVDPLSCDARTYEIVVNAALQRVRPSVSPSRTLSSMPPRSAKTYATEEAGSGSKKTFKKDAEGLARNMFTRKVRPRPDMAESTMAGQPDGRGGTAEAKLYVQLLCSCVERLPSTPMSARTPLHDIIRHFSEIISTCALSQQQHEAFYAAPSIQHSPVQGSSMGMSGSSVLDPVVLLFEVLRREAEMPTLVVQTALAAIAALVRSEQPGTSSHFHMPRPAEPGPFAIVADKLSDKSSLTRLAAAECQVNVYKNLKELGGGWEKDVNTALVTNVLLQLLSEPNLAINARAAFILAYFTADDQALQETAHNMKAFKRLREVFHRLSRPIEPYSTSQADGERSRCLSGCLLAVAALCTEVEEMRRQVLEERLLTHVITALASPFPNVRCAAAQCTRALSRSTNLLKAALVDTQAAPALVALLNEHDSPLTQLAACAVMSNVFIEFSPLKNVLLEMDGLVEHVIELTKSVTPRGWTGAAGQTKLQAMMAARLEDEQDREKWTQVYALLRLHALAAIKNMTYWSSSALKQKTIQCFGWDYIVALLRDPDPSVQVIVLNILRNIACNEWSDIDLVVRGIGEARLYSLIEEALWSTKNDILTNALYLISNIATGSDAHRAAALNRQGITRAILSLLSHAGSEIRVAAVWAVVNLGQRSDGGNRRVNDNAAKLRALGIEKRLKEMRDDPSIDVRERVKDALDAHFDPSELGSDTGGGGFGGPGAGHEPPFATAGGGFFRGRGSPVA